MAKVRIRKGLDDKQVIEVKLTEQEFDYDWNKKADHVIAARIKAFQAISDLLDCEFLILHPRGYLLRQVRKGTDV